MGLRVTPLLHRFFFKVYLTSINNATVLQCGVIRLWGFTLQARNQVTKEYRYMQGERGPMKSF